MSEFSVRCDRITRFADVLDAQAKILENAADSADTVGRNLRMQGLSDRSVKSSIGSIGNAARKEALTARRMGTALREIAEAYRAAENTILGASGLTGTGGSLRGTSHAGTGGSAGMGGLAFTNGNGTVSALYSSDPVNLNTGNFVLDNQDMEIPGFLPLRLGRFYNSMGSCNGMLGANWNSSFERRLVKNPSYFLAQADASVMLEDGREEYFAACDDGRYRPVSGTTASLAHTEKGYVYRTLNGERSWFDDDGRFVRLEDMHQTGFSLIYKEDALVRVEKDSGEYFDFFYQDGNRLDSVCDHTGRVCRYYFEGDYLRKVVLPDGTTYEYTYNSYGKISRVQNPRQIGAVETEYDEWQRVIFQRFADGTTNIFEYRDEERAVIMTERNGVRSTHIHDEKYQNIRNVYADGEECFEYNELGQKTVLSDRLGNVTRLQYDDRGNITTILTADRTKICATYSDQNRLLTISVNGKNRLRNVYNASGDLIIRENAVGEKTEYSYDDQGHTTQIRLPDGTSVNAWYDDRGNLCTLQGANGSITQFEYDALNRRVARTDANGNWSAYAYDVMGRLIRETRPDGYQKQYQYDQMGNLISEENFDGSVTATVYNENNRPLSVTDPAGRRTDFEYDSMWRLAGMTLPNGGVFRYRYDENGHLECVCDAEGNETHYTCDAAGNVLSRTDAMGMATDFAWDTMGRCTRVTGADGAVMEYRYNENGQVVYEKGADGTESFRTYDAEGRLTSEKDSLGHRNIYTYNLIGQVIGVTDENGRCTRYQYAKGSDAPELIQYPDGTEESFAYDANGNLVCFTDIYGASLHYQYDNLNRLNALLTEQGERMEFGYDPSGRMVFRKDFEGNVTKYSYTPTGQLQSVTDALGHTTRYSYDAIDYLAEVLREAPKTGLKAMDETPQAGSEILRETSEDGRKWLHEALENKAEAFLEAQGAGSERTRSVTEKESWVVWAAYERDRMGRLTKLTDAAGETEEYRYNGLGQMTEKTDRAGLLTQYAYNCSGLLQRITWADGKRAEYRYDSSGRLCEADDWTGKTGIQYDHLGNVTEIQYPDGRALHMDYDARGNRVRVRYPEGQSVEYEYDRLDRLTRMTHEECVVSYLYDEFGRISSRLLPDGRNIQYQYDAKGMLAGMSCTDGEGLLDDFSYRYDSLGRRIQCDAFRRDDAAEGGCFQYLYDPVGRLDRVSLDGRLLREYEYDVLGNRSSLLRFQSKRGAYERIQYEYDRRGGMLHSVRSELIPSDCSGVLPSDSPGVIPPDCPALLSSDCPELFPSDCPELSKKDGAGTDCRLIYTEACHAHKEEYQTHKEEYQAYTEGYRAHTKEYCARTDYRYDRRGNLVEVLCNGSTEKKYEYDARNRLSYAEAGDGDTAAYEYNGLGYRVGMRQSLAGTERTITYTLDYSKIYDNLMERREAEESEVFFWGNQLEGFAADPGAHGWYLSDAQGNVLRKMVEQVVLGNELQKMDDGTILKSGQCRKVRIGVPGLLYQNRYDEFGSLLPDNGGKEKVPDREEFGFSGFLYDPVAGTWFAQARQYRGETGMFDAMDRFGGDITMPDSLNPYSYCVHDPLNHTDKSAYWFLVDDMIAAAIGGAGGFAGQLVSDVMESVTSGQFTHSDWKTYLSSTTGGAAGGVTTLYAGPIAGGAVSGAVSTLTGEGLTYLSNPGGYTKSLGNVAKETVLNAGLGGLTGAVSGVIGKATRKLANTTVVQGVVSKLQGGGKLAGMAANYITGIASPTTKAWSDMTNVIKNYHGVISSSASLLASMEAFMVDNVPLYLKEEVLSRVTGRLKPTNILTGIGKSRLSSWLKDRLGLSENTSDAYGLCAVS